MVRDICHRHNLPVPDASDMEYWACELRQIHNRFSRPPYVTSGAEKWFQVVLDESFLQTMVSVPYRFATNWTGKHGPFCGEEECETTG